MPILLTSLWNWVLGSKIAQWAIGLTSLLIALFFGYERAKMRGAQEERSENSAEILDTIDQAKPIQDQIQQMAPDKQREELSKWSR